MSDKPTTYEEGMFDHMKVEQKKPTMPFEDCFQQGMGTELMAPLLYSLVRFVRPQTILEVFTTCCTSRVISRRPLQCV